MAKRANADELPTEDLSGVEILSVGGPIHGVGSPPEGDFWKTEDLEAIAAANRELAAEIRAPGKIGHDPKQRLASATEGEMPAVGWLDGASFRVSEDGQKLLTDVKDIPAKTAKLIKARGYRTRSVELSKVTSQTSGKVYDWVVTGLAWLGGKMPAVQTLDDVVALYHDDGVELVRVIDYTAGDIVWSPEASFRAIQEDISTALNGAGGYRPDGYWVQDVSAVGTALVSQGEDSDAWVVSWSRAADGSISVAPSSDWVAAEKTWIETAKGYANGKKPTPSDTRSTVAKITLTDEQQKTLADSLGLEGDEISVEKLLEAAETAGETDATLTDEQRDELAKSLGVEGEVTPEKLLEAAKAKGSDSGRQLEQDDLVRRLEVAEKDATETKEELRLERRRHFVEDELMGKGKIEPGEREKWEGRFDKDEEMARSFGEDLKPDETLLRELGSDEDGTGEDSEEVRKLEAAQDSARLGIPEEELV